MKKPDPKVEWGFFAITPRIVRTQYKELSHTEKWLYVCLKDLCGDKGVCYRTLKVLSQETDLSTGNLSTGIRRLHDAGLIHAEKKRRSALPTAKEVWHISIVDIWQANVEHCSNFERPTENVQEMNDNVQILNEPTPERSKNEPKRSNFVDRRITPEEETITEERTDEEEGAIAPTPPLSSSQEDDFDPETTQFYQNWLRNCEVARANGDPLPPRPKHMIVDSAAELLSESAKLKAIVTAQLNRFEVTSEMETPADGDGAATTQRMAAVKIGGTNGERIDAAVHGAGDRGAGDDTDGQSRAGLAGVSAGVAGADRASSGAVSAGLALSSNTSVAASQTVRGATDALGSRSGGATLPHAARLSPASGSESRAPGGKPRIPERPKMERPQLTLEGSQVKGWLEDIWDVTISQRAGNIKDLNDLGALCDVTRESLDMTITFLEAKKWVKEHDVVITLHILSGNDPKFQFLSFESNWQSARRKKSARSNDTLADGKTSSIYAI